MYLREIYYQARKQDQQDMSESWVGLRMVPYGRDWPMAGISLFVRTCLLELLHFTHANLHQNMIDTMYWTRGDAVLYFAILIGWCCVVLYCTYGLYTMLIAVYSWFTGSDTNMAKAS